MQLFTQGDKQGHVVCAAMSAMEEYQLQGR